MNPHEDALPKRRGGRPNTGKRGTFTFRVTDSLRQKLEEQAAASGRPVSEEIEMRLEASFVQPSPHSVGVLALVGSTINMIEQLMGSKWNEDQGVAIEARAAIDEILDKFMPRSTSSASGTAVERVAAALLRQNDGVLGAALGRSLAGEKIGDEAERRAAFEALEMAAIRRAERDPAFRQSLVDYVENSSGQQSE